jgi:hypothetical protein
VAKVWQMGKSPKVEVEKGVTEVDLSNEGRGRNQS